MDVLRVLGLLNEWLSASRSERGLTVGVGQAVQDRAPLFSPFCLARNHIV